MRLSLLGIFLLFCRISFALSLPADLGYRQDLMALPEAETEKISTFFDAANFQRAVMNGEAMPTYDLDWASAVYLDTRGNGMVILKSDIETTVEISENLVYRVTDEEFIVHLKASRPGHWNALYFDGYTEADVQRFVQHKVLSSSLKRENTYVRSELLSRTLAATPDTSLCTGSVSSMTPTAAQQVSAMGSAVLRNVLQCARGALAGAWNATGGAVVTLFKGVVKVFTQSPVQTFRDIRNSVNRIGSFISNFGTEMRKIGDAFDQLPTEIKTRVICEVITTIGVSAAIGMLTGGAGSTLVYRAVFAIMDKLRARFPGSRALARFEDQVTRRAQRRFLYPVEPAPILQGVARFRALAAEYRYALVRSRISGILDQMNRFRRRRAGDAVVSAHRRGGRTVPARQIRMTSAEIFEQFRDNPSLIHSGNRELRDLMAMESRLRRNIPENSDIYTHRLTTGDTAAWAQFAARRKREMRRLGRNIVEGPKKRYDFGNSVATTAQAAVVACTTAISVMGRENALTREIERLAERARHDHTLPPNRREATRAVRTAS